MDTLLGEAMYKTGTAASTLSDEQLYNLKTVFAKSIIEECAKVADANFDSGFCPVGGFIREHFDIMTMMVFTLD